MTRWLLAFGIALAASAALALDIGPVTNKIVEGTNRFRAGEGLEPVAPNGDLAQAAREFADYMARTGRYGHTADGRNPSERAQAAGYAYCIVAENIGYQYRSPDFATAAELADAFVRGWIESPEHRANLTDADLTEIGVGLAQDAKGRYFAVQLFGRPRSAAIRFEVENRGPEAVRYAFGEQGFALGVRQRRAHTVCTPTRLSIDRPPKGSPYATQAADGTRYTIRDGEVTVETVR